MALVENVQTTNDATSAAEECRWRDAFADLEVNVAALVDDARILQLLLEHGKSELALHAVTRLCSECLDLQDRYNELWEATMDKTEAAE